MGYTISKTVDYGFDEAISRVTANLKENGFGVLTEIDVSKTLKDKLDVAFRKYKILGACSPPFAYEAIKCEPDIGAMMPCNVLVRETGDGAVKVAAVDPVASMAAVENPELAKILKEVKAIMGKVIAGL